MTDHDFPVFYTQTEDGTWLAASVTAPLFCLSAPTEQEAQVAAQGAIEFWVLNRGARATRRPEIRVTPFAPQRVGVVSVLEACA